MATVEQALAKKQSRSEILRQKIEEKRRIEKDSLSAVEVLLERGITEETFIAQCRLLWQQSYQDCNEERAIDRLCGYPLCDNPVDAIHKKSPEYKICARTNKVYSLKNRRSFCSAWCYKASEWVKCQLSEVPFWMLESPFDKQIELLRKEVLESPKVNEESTSQAVPPGQTKNFKKNPSAGNADSDADCVITSPKRITLDDVDRCAEELAKVRIDPPTVIPVPSRTAPVKPKKTLPPSKLPEESHLVEVGRLEKLLCEWITISTLHHILGQERFLEVRSQFDQGTEGSKLEDTEYALRYERLCRFLDEQDRLEGLADDDAEASKDRAKPIKRRTKSGVVKKVNFNDVSSKTVVNPPDVATSSSSSPPGARTPAETLGTARPLNDLPEPVLPPVDKHQRNATRRQILLERLTPVANKLASHLQMPQLQLLRELSELIDTFHLTKDNCMLQPSEALVVFLAAVMLIDRRAGGEGALPETLRAYSKAPLNSLGLSWGDLRTALTKATNPSRLFQSKA